jgi:hypothetical protein
VLLPLPLLLLLPHLLGSLFGCCCLRHCCQRRRLLHCCHAPLACPAAPHNPGLLLPVQLRLRLLLLQLLLLSQHIARTSQQ